MSYPETPQEIVVETALSQWSLYTPSHKLIYGEYIRGARGLAWTWIKDGEPFAWCGALASYCLGAAGVDLAIRHAYLASTGRLYRGVKKTTAYKRVSPKDIRPGDIAVVSDKPKKVEGTHIAVVVNVDGGVLYTVEGNALGLRRSGATGTQGYGVVKATRPLRVEDGGPGLNWTCPLTDKAATHVVVHGYRFFDLKV